MVKKFMKHWRHIKGGFVMYEEIKRICEEEISDDDLQKLLDENPTVNKEIQEMVDSIKSGHEKKELYSELRTICNNEKSVEKIIDFVDSELLPYEETAFLREKSIEDFAFVIEYFISNFLIHSEDHNVIIKDLKITEEKFDVLRKFTNTINDFIIVKRFTRTRFNLNVYDYFGMGDDVTEVLWSCFNRNRRDLIEVMEMKYLQLNKYTNADLRKLLDFFASVFKDDAQDV